jgi:hypothetical protein
MSEYEKPAPKIVNLKETQIKLIEEAIKLKLDLLKNGDVKPKIVRKDNGKELNLGEFTKLIDKLHIDEDVKDATKKAIFVSGFDSEGQKVDIISGFGGRKVIIVDGYPHDIDPGFSKSGGNTRDIDPGMDPGYNKEIEDRISGKDKKNEFKHDIDPGMTPVIIYTKKKIDPNPETLKALEETWKKIDDKKGKKL